MVIESFWEFEEYLLANFNKSLGDLANVVVYIQGIHPLPESQKESQAFWNTL